MVAMRTEPPLRSWDLPPSKESASKSRRRRLVSAPETIGSHVSTVLLTASQREAGLFWNMLIKLDEIAERNRKLAVLQGRKRIDSKGVFKPAYKNSETK
jgi:hypothetical protein